MFKLTFPGDTSKGILMQYDVANTILEYGTGGSTVHAAKHGNKKIFAVESDKEWLENLATYVEEEDLPGTVVPVYIDVGVTKVWGYPVDDSAKENYPNYSIEPWKLIQETKSEVDLVLIDGRFRVACFFATVAAATKITKVIMDDYVEREHYHVVEEICKPKEFYGRAAMFEIYPGMMSSLELMQRFSYFSDAR